MPSACGASGGICSSSLSPGLVAVLLTGATSSPSFAPVYEAAVDETKGRLATRCVPAQHETRLFLLDDSGVQPLAHDRYVALARDEAAAVEFAGRRFILVDWYLRMACGQAEAVVNETCSWLVFNGQGLLDPHAAHAIDAEADPTEEQWAQVRVLVFGDASVALGR